MMPVNLRKNTKLPFSKSKKLIVSGCSYSDNWWTKKHGFLVWPELLAKKLDMECVNLAKCGKGNEYIYSSILDYLFLENIGLVVVMWSEFGRLDFYRNYFYNNKEIYKWDALHFPVKDGTVNRHDDVDNVWKNKIMKELYEMGIGEDIGTTRRSIRMFYMFQQTMKSLNIPFLMIMGTFPITRKLHLINPKIQKDIIDSHYLTSIDKNSFIGWPIFPELGGWNIDTLLDKYEDVRISLDDCHPNEKGHKIISQEIYKHYELEYGTIF